MRRIAPRTVPALLGALAMGLTACGGIEPVAPASAPITDPMQLYMRLTLDHPAVNLSTVSGYNTQQLTATPRDALGNPMTGLPAPSFRSRDTTKVLVTADGMLTAVETSNQGTEVIAELTVGPVTHADTALVKVVGTAPSAALASLSIDPVPPDSAVWSIPDLTGTAATYFIFQVLGLWPVPQVTAHATTTTGGAMSGLIVDYESLDPAIATVSRRDGSVNPLYPGQVRMVAQTAAYGVVATDTVTYTVTPPAGQDFFIRPGPTGALGFSSTTPIASAQSNELRIAPSGVVGWQIAPEVWQADSLGLGDSVDVVFDDPTNVVSPPAELCDILPFVLGPDPYCGTGNLIVPARGNDPFGNVFLTTIRFRKFPVPGIYPFRSLRTGATGRVIVSNTFD